MGLLQMSFSAAVLILVIVIVRMLLLHKLPKKTFLVLWGVAICRLLIPFSIPTRYSIYSIAQLLEKRFLKADLTITGMPLSTNNTAIMETASPLPDAVYVISPMRIIWFIGLTACALFFLVTHLRYRKEYRTALPIDNAFVTRWQQERSIWRNVQIRQSDRIAAPLTYGIFRPVILLPNQTDWMDETRLRYILMHEFVHIRRFDTLTKLILATALCVHWFNPFVWLMNIFANRDIELSCDTAVVRAFGGNIGAAYALTLVGLEEKKSRLALLVNNFSKNVIEERIVSIVKMKKRSLFTVVSAVILVLGITVVFATSRANTYKPEYNGKNMTDAIVEDSGIACANLYIDKILVHFGWNGSETEDISGTLAAAIADTESTGLYDYAITHILDFNADDDTEIVLRYEALEFIPALSVILKDSGHDARGQVVAAVYQEYANSIEESLPEEFGSMEINLKNWMNR